MLDQTAWIKAFHAMYIELCEMLPGIKDEFRRRFLAMSLATAWMFEYGFVGKDNGRRLLEREQKYGDTLNQLHEALDYLFSMTVYPPWELKHYNSRLHVHARSARDLLLWFSRQPLPRDCAKKCTDLGYLVQQLVVCLDRMRDKFKVDEIELRDKDIFELVANGDLLEEK